MPIVFKAAPGSVVALDDPATQCQARFETNPPITFDSEMSIVTRLTVNQQVNVQFLHTLGALIYIYVFGDRMGQIGLSGLAFSCDCTGSDVGADKILQWYSRNRVSKKKDPVQITIGSTTLEGFVVNCTEDVVDPSLRLVQWGVNMAALPED